MNHNIFPLFYKLKNALKQKQLQIIIKFTFANLVFLRFLLEKGFISGFTKNIRKKHKILVVYLKYGFDYQSVIQDFSSVSKTSKKLKKKLISKKKQTNFIINLYNNNRNYSKKNFVNLISKFR